MKKTGFTLAEVLITLAIIGVVATMTLPALMNNTQEQQSRTGLKKVINTLTVAAEMSAADKGYDYSAINRTSSSDDVGSDEATENRQSLYRLFLNNTQVDLRATQAFSSHKTDANNFVVFFRDGSSIEYPNSAAPGMGSSIKAIVDINGNKAPNLMSNCRSNITAFSTTTASISDSGNGSDCSSKAKKVIRDRYSVLLEDQHVIPNGPAARYSYSK